MSPDFYFPVFSLHVLPEQKRFLPSNESHSDQPYAAQLLDHYRAASAGGKDHELHALIQLSFHSTVIEGACLTLAQTRDLIQTGQPISDNLLSDQWYILNHFQALVPILAMASQRQPINRIALQDIAATLMRQTGGLTHQHYHHVPLSGVQLNYRAAYLTALETNWPQKTAVSIVDFIHGQLLGLLEGGSEVHPHDPECE